MKIRRSAIVFAALCVINAQETRIYRHAWDTVADVMGMHGKVHTGSASDAAIAFAGKHYSLVTTGASCPSNKSVSIEDLTLSLAAGMKAVNPKIKVGMYWRTDMILEIAQCSEFSPELKSHGTDWFLHDDKGALVKRNNNYLMDYGNKGYRDFFQKVLVNVVNATLPSGIPQMDFIYLDGPGYHDSPGIGPVRSAQLAADKMQWISDLQTTFNSLSGGGRNVLVNGVDNFDSAKQFSSTGVAAAMIDHWSILQFLNRNQTSPEYGNFNQTAMDELFGLARSETLANMTVEIKGWVGPVIKQRGIYPPSIPTPKTPAEQAQVAGERFNSELALFLLVAEDYMYWLYSWFWTFDDWVPDEADSTIPHGFFPQAKCALGKPAGPPKRNPGTWTYSREYEHASVYVDLNNRTASRVDFKGSC
jgi:hypothetical protein